MESERYRPIMVIDDSPTVRKIIEVTLKREGYEVICFPDGVEALNWLNTPEGCAPALVLLDICMPRMSGYEVAWYFKARVQFAHTQVVIMSGYCGMVERIKARLVGACAYLEKPLTVERLLATVQAYAGRGLRQGEERVRRMRVRLVGDV